jgi:tetratricopeptide (TPR) repeat protein
LPEALAATQKALELDDSLAEVHASLGWIKFFFDGDWAGADAEFKRAMELDPEYAIAHQWRAALLAFCGKSDEAIAEAELALTLDPLSLSIGTALTMILYMARQYDRAIEQAKKVLQMHPDFRPVHSMLAYSYLGKGLPAKAVEVLEKTLDLAPENPHQIGDLACIYARVGMLDKAEPLYRRLQQMRDGVYVPAYVMALVCTAMGRTDEAFEYLEEVIDERYGLYHVKTDQRLDDLHSDPRFAQFLKKAGLGE